MFRLIVTRPDGTQTQSSAEPLPTRHDAGLSVMRVLAGEGVRFGIDGKRLGRQVRDAAIGETLTHEPSGYRFRTEPF